MAPGLGIGQQWDSSVFAWWSQLFGGLGSAGWEELLTTAAACRAALEAC